jgi:uncharacterized protein (TIGR02246 family)
MKHIVTHLAGWGLFLCLAAGAALAQQVAPAAATPPSHGTPADVAAIRALASQFADAFNRGDAKAIADQYGEAARAFDDDGQSIVGRDAILARFEAGFRANPGLRVTFQEDRLEFLSPTVAIEDGRGTTNTVPPVVSAYSVVYVKEGDRWRIAQTRDHASVPSDPNTDPRRARLAELEWMIGEWVDETDEATVHTTCAWDEDGPYLVRRFVVKVKGSPMTSGTQRIGWDPARGRARSWVFDADGGFSEGLWSRVSEDEWAIDVRGTLPDGRAATALNRIMRLDAHRMLWKSTNQTIDGLPTGADEQYVIVRTPPKPAGGAKPAPAPGTTPAASPVPNRD